MGPRSMVLRDTFAEVLGSGVVGPPPIFVTLIGCTRRGSYSAKGHVFAF